MLYLEQFQNNRVDYLKQYRRLHSSLDRNFSLCSTQYSEKFPKIRQIQPAKIDYSRDQTLFFLSKKSTTDMPIRKHFDMSKQRIRVLLKTDGKLFVHGQRVQSQQQPLLLYYSGNKTTNENQQQIGTVQKNKSPDPTRWYHQVSRNVTGTTKMKSKGNQFSTSFPLPMDSSMDSDRPTTVPIIVDDDMHRRSTKTNKRSRPINPHLVNLADNFDDLADSSIFRFRSPICESDNQFRQRSYTDTFLDSSIIEAREETPDERPKIPQETTRQKADGFRHIANLGSWQGHFKPQSTKSPAIDLDEVASNYSNNRTYEYKSPFSEEYDQAILIQTHTPSVYNPNNEWNLKEFYRDVKTPFESGTNTKAVFEKCLKLSKLQANTIKWEQRRRQNMNIYNRLIKNSTYDSSFLNMTGNLSSHLADLKRELRCTECKRVSCLGNCAPGQEYNQYKRSVPYSPVPTTREQVRCKLGLRTQRSMIDIRPRSQQMVRAEPANLNPVVCVPLFEDEATNKRPQRKLAHGFLPGKSLRSQRRETLTFYSSHKVSS